MAFDGAGNYIRIHNWQQDAANGLNISAPEMDGEDNSIAGALSLCVTRDGQGKMTADLLPNTDNTLNLGSNTKRWATLNGVAIPTTQANIGAILYPQSPAEGAAAVIPTFYFYPPGDSRRYNTVGNGVADDTVPLRNTILPNQPVKIRGISGNTPLITGALTFVNKGQLIEGDGRDFTKIMVTAAFSLAALGVCIISTAEPAPVFRDWQIAFVQPDTAVRANLVAYPPGIYGSAQPRLTLQDFKITNAMTGISLIGNSGGAIFDLLEMSAYTTGINIDGALDTMRIDKWHYFPFSMTANQQVIFNDANNTAFNCARCDDLKVSNGLLIGTLGTAMNFYVSASGPTLGEVVATDFDSYGGIKISGTVAQPHVLTFDGCVSTIGTAGAQAIKLTGAGFVKMSGHEFDAAVVLTNPMVEVTGGLGGQGAALVISGAIFRISGDHVAAKVSASAGANMLTISDSDFFLPQNTSPANPVVWAAAGGRLSFIGNRTTDKGSGTGAFTQCDVDERHIITANAYLGWNAVLPATANNYNFFGNNSVANAGTGTLATNRGTSAFAAATTVVVTHGVNAFVGRVPLASEILITPTSSPAGITWYVSAISATTFTLTASGATSMSFGWQVTNPTLT